MNSIYDGLLCPVCHARFFEDEDVVVCPVCGAPHHRECWQSLGHCAHEDTHGTEHQWQPEAEPNPPPSPEGGNTAELRCPFCGKTAEKDTLFCPQCGHAFDPAGKEHPSFVNPFAPPAGDPLGGVKKDTSIDGHSAEEVASLVAVNSNWYLPRFEKFSQSGNKKKAAWNWAAFLFPSYWLFWRKCYWAGSFALILSLVSQMLYYPLSAELSAILPQGISYAESVALLSTQMDAVSSGAMLLAALGGSLVLLTNLFFGLFGTYVYKKHCIDRLDQLAKPDLSGDPRIRFVRARGVNLLGPLLAMALMDLLYFLLITLL